MEEKKHITPLKFVILITFCIVVLSTILNLLGIQTNNTSVISDLFTTENNVVTVNSMFSLDGLKYIISNALANFIGFAPLGTLLISLIGIGVLEKSGFTNTLNTLIGKYIPKKTLTFIVALVGIIATVSIDSAFVFLIPLAAFLYMVNGRNPITGITVAFASIAAGYGINFVFSLYEPTLNSMSTVAASLVDKEYILNIWGNVIFMIIATIILAIAITEITEKIVAAKIGPYEEEVKEITIGKKEKRGLILSLIVFGIAAILIIYSILPEGIPGCGFLLDNTKYNYVHKLFGTSSYFVKGLPFIISLVLALMGYAYGVGAKTIKRQPHILENSVSNVSYAIVLIFFTAQAIAILKESNLGVFLVNFLIESIKTIELTGLPLILILFLFTIISNLFVTSPFIKWNIMAPVVVPMFMTAGMSPEFAQIIFRTASSASNLVTPFFAYFVVYVIYLQKYSKETLTLKKVYSYLLPYSIFIGVIWLILILGWYIIGIPVGINIFPILN